MVGGETSEPNGSTSLRDAVEGELKVLDRRRDLLDTFLIETDPLSY